MGLATHQTPFIVFPCFNSFNPHDSPGGLGGGREGALVLSTRDMSEEGWAAAT